MARKWKTIRPWLPILLLLGLAACATRPGNLAHAPVADDRLMARDTVKRLAALYPPAGTRFDLQQPAADPYGQALVEALRTRGYAVMERQGKNAPGTKEPPPQADGLALSYVLDRPATDLYRVVVRVGPATLSRAYTVGSGRLVPAGAWARAEGG